MSEETVGQRLRRLRNEKKLSQTDVSDEGVTTAHISRIESGQRQPSIKSLRTLARKLGVSVEYLETGSDWTATDYLLEEVAARLTVNAPPGASKTFQIDAVDPFDVDITWRRWYEEPSQEYADAGFSGGESDERSIRGDSLTEALRAVLAYEDEADEQDARVVEAYSTTVEAKKKHGGRPAAGTRTS